jgi:serine/threonine protein kinase
VDIWALGVTFFYLMYFTFPYVGNNTFELSGKIALGIRVKEDKFNKDLYSDEFRNLIEKMLSRKQNDRPSAEMILKEDSNEKKYCSEYDLPLQYNIPIGSVITSSIITLENCLTISANSFLLSITNFTFQFSHILRTG